MHPAITNKTSSQRISRGGSVCGFFFHTYCSQVSFCLPVFYTHIDALNPRYIMYMARSGYGVDVTIRHLCLPRVWEPGNIWAAASRSRCNINPG